MLTENQKNNIHKLSLEECLEILHECKERLGLVSQSEYVKITGYKFTRENLVQDMKKGKIKFWKLGSFRFPIINW